MFTASDLRVLAARSNPHHYKAPHQNWERFAEHMLDAGVTLTVSECAYGDEDHVRDLDGICHIPVRAKTHLWTKENLLNICIRRTPEAKYIAWIDADVIFHRMDWATASIEALQHYDIRQPWDTCRDFGPNGKAMQTHRSFCHSLPLIAIHSGMTFL